MIADDFDAIAARLKHIQRRAPQGSAFTYPRLDEIERQQIAIERSEAFNNPAHPNYEDAHKRWEALEWASNQ